MWSLTTDGHCAADAATIRETLQRKEFLQKATKLTKGKEEEGNDMEVAEEDF